LTCPRTHMCQVQKGVLSPSFFHSALVPLSLVPIKLAVSLAAQTEHIIMY
jgi:hypothetical protein